MAKTMEEVLERFRTIEFHDDFDMIVAIANGGIVPAGIINQRLQKEVHLRGTNTNILNTILRNCWLPLILISRERAFYWWTTA